jgi:hypothetical protein
MEGLLIATRKKGIRLRFKNSGMQLTTNSYHSQQTVCYNRSCYVLFMERVIFSRREAVIVILS